MIYISFCILGKSSIITVRQSKEEILKFTKETYDHQYIVVLTEDGHLDGVFNWDFESERDDFKTN